MYTDIYDIYIYVCIYDILSLSQHHSRDRHTANTRVEIPRRLPGIGLMTGYAWCVTQSMDWTSIPHFMCELCMVCNTVNGLDINTSLHV